MTVIDDITTERLLIHPLNDAEFSAMMNGLEQLEIRMGITVSGEVPNAELHVAMEWLALQMVIHPEDFPWWTVWHMRLRKGERSVGCFCFRGPPDDSGGVEIGYAFVYPTYLDQGFMTEAVGAVTDWAFQQNDVVYVMAEVEGWNIPAQRIFEKNGYLCYNETKSSKFYWKRRPETSR
ncbi:MAG: GNAT family N-acetyltransferase [Thermoguttaceae bacterium]|jgi:ribosomal-protein-alanine N-acetyltransferase